MGAKSAGVRHSGEANKLLEQQIATQKLQALQRKQQLSQQEFAIIKEQSGLNWDAQAPKQI